MKKYKVYTNSEDSDLILEATSERGVRTFQVFEKISSLRNYCEENGIDIPLTDFENMESMRVFQEKVLSSLARIEIGGGSKGILSLSEAAEYLGYSKAHLYRLTSEKKIPHSKMNGQIRFDRDKLAKWALKNEISTMEEIESRATLHVISNPKPNYHGRTI